MEDVDIFSLTIDLASNTARSADLVELAQPADKHDLLQYAVFNY
jgi:hypothetical protein